MKIFGYDISVRKSSQESYKVPFSRTPFLMYPFQSEMRQIPPNDPFAQIQNYASWVYVCANKNAQAVASIPLRMYIAKPTAKTKVIVRTKEVSKETLKFLSSQPSIAPKIKGADEIVEVAEHPFLDLISKMNPLSNRFDTFELTELFMELTGNGYWYMPRGSLNIPDQIWCMPSQNMQVVPAKEGGLIKGYVYRKGNILIPYEPDEIVHFKFPNPSNTYYGHSPLSSIGLTVKLLEAMGRFELVLLDNMARPDGVLQTDQSLTDEEFERLKREWKETYGGVNKAGQTAILEKGLTYNAITMTPKDLNYQAGRKISMQEIAACYGVPLSKLTTDDVNKANAEVGEVQYKRDTISPRMIRFQEKLNERVMPLYDDNVFCAFDNPVPEDRQARIIERESNLRSGYSCVNEERALDGRRPVDWGEIPIMPVGMVPLGSAAPPGSAGPIPGMPEPSLPEPIPGAGPLSEMDIHEFVEKVVGEIKLRVAQ